MILSFVNHTARRAVTIGAGLLLACVLLYSQGSEGRISGTITDQSGAAIPSAKVTITDVQRNVSRAVTTDAAGAYAAPNLIPSTYSVRVEFQGFKNIDRRDLVLEVGQELRVDVSMQPGEQSQTVTVTGEVAALKPPTRNSADRSQNQVINDLPLNGRNFENLLDLRPGVAKYPGNSGWTQATNGLRPHDNFFMVDGINSNDPWMAQSMMNAVMAAGDAGTMLPIDAIDEFKTQQNPRAEYGWKPGAVVNVGIKSGSNGFHGTAYAYGRTNSWDANNFFSNEVGQPHSSPLTRTVWRQRRRPHHQGQALLLWELRIPAIQRGQPVCPQRPVHHAGRHRSRPESGRRLSRRERPRVRR